MHLKPGRKEWQYDIIQLTVVAMPTFGMYRLLERSISMTWNSAIIYDRYMMIN